MKEIKKKILNGVKEFNALTMFPPDRIICNLHTREKIKNLIDDKGNIKFANNLRVLVSYKIEKNNELLIGMYDCPTYVTVKIYDS